MIKIKLYIWIPVVLCIFIAAQCTRIKSIPTCHEDTDVLPYLFPDSLAVKKPNIYLYPEQTETLDVTLMFPVGGRLLKSEPAYQNGWHISVHTSGIINEQYRFLFYESMLPNHFQTAEGWIIAKDDLASFFQSNLEDYGFIQPEINDFLEYWMPLLDEYSFYLIFPQNRHIVDQMVILNISKHPDSVQRLLYLFKGSNSNRDDINPPQIDPFIRNGFTVVEWGGMLAE